MFLRNILASRITPQTLFETFNLPEYTITELKSLLSRAFKEGIDPNIEYEGRTLLECYCMFSMVDMVQFLLENRANPNHGKSLLHIVRDLPDTRNNIIAKLLLQHGASTELKDSSGWTLIKLAA